MSTGRLAHKPYCEATRARLWRAGSVVLCRGCTMTWWTDVVGYRAARRRVREVATGLERGSHPEREGLVLAPANEGGAG